VLFVDDGRLGDRFVEQRVDHGRDVDAGLAGDQLERFPVTQVALASEGFGDHGGELGPLGGRVGDGGERFFAAAVEGLEAGGGVRVHQVAVLFEAVADVALAFGIVAEVGDEVALQGRGFAFVKLVAAVFGQFGHQLPGALGAEQVEQHALHIR